ncbi:hypothetical protein [Erythrobacter sp. THAF29]|uniref:hypothetical protein n=1 Tax=Erythrobacter sp. THAF29 TaxID=2587851 RepID=UPI0012694F5F|nr:hypothetical protein [Erythrobacter sp. THAF29]QFT75998.1 hypothetical protein FIU90_00445 [Erythrobacter sp. THAF29]
MSATKFLAALAITGLTTSEAQAAEYLTEVTSEVYQTHGTVREITTRAQTCISQHLASGVTGGQLIINADLDGGIVVANSAIEYGSLPRWQIRSRFTFESREGRFRIQQTNLERFNDQFNVGWHPIGKWAGSQWRKAEEAFAASATLVAKCVRAESRQEHW